MKISYNWLGSYVSLEGHATDEVAAMLTRCGLEVEGMEKYESVKGGLVGLVVGKVITCERHPNADKLSLTTVDIGSGTPLQIVCGAPNVAAGQTVVVAPVGTTVHPKSGEPFEIRKSKIRGELSEGMICAEDEIGLGTSHAGIMLLPDHLAVGTLVKDHFKIEDDTVFEIGLTPNRVDAASHIGTARDLVAILNLRSGTTDAFQVKFPSVEAFREGSGSDTIAVEVDDSVGCPRYSGITLENVQVGPSPAWLQDRLKAIGLNPINNVVDVTNFVLHECGQPLHAFDADKIEGGRVVVRRAREAEQFVTLDGVERTLTRDDLMICDTKKPMCMAGVFGGVGSGITASTRRVFIESAYFDSGSIRKTSKHHGLKTDASFRYERGADPSITIHALKRAALLLCEVAGARIASAVIDHYPKPIPLREIRLDYQRLDRFVGLAIPSDSVSIILKSLGMQIVHSETDGCTVQVPAAKVDVERPVDLYEEVLRIYGYDEVPLPGKLISSLPTTNISGKEALRRAITGFLVANGFNELLTNSLVDTGIESTPDSSTSVRILNPLSQELGMMRTDMFTSVLEAARYNHNRKQDDLRFFEFGRTYLQSADAYKESERLAMLLSGDRTAPSWNTPAKAVDFFLLKGFVQRILEQCGHDLHSLEQAELSSEAFASGMTISAGKKVLVRFGQLRKSVLRKYDLPVSTVFADFDWDAVSAVYGNRRTKVNEIPRFPQVRRDLSMVIDRSVQFGQIESLAYKTEKKLLKDVQLFDVYEGEKVEAGKKSYAMTFLLLDEQQTLTDQQIDKVMNRLMAAFEKEVGAVIRKG